MESDSGPAGGNSHALLRRDRARAEPRRQRRQLGGGAAEASDIGHDSGAAASGGAATASAGDANPSQIIVDDGVTVLEVEPERMERMQCKRKAAQDPAPADRRAAAAQRIQAIRERINARGQRVVGAQEWRDDELRPQDPIRGRSSSPGTARDGDRDVVEPAAWGGREDSHRLATSPAGRRGIRGRSPSPGREPQLSRDQLLRRLRASGRSDAVGSTAATTPAPPPAPGEPPAAALHAGRRLATLSPALGRLPPDRATLLRRLRDSGT